MRYPKTGEVYHQPKAHGRTWRIVGVSKSAPDGETLISYQDASGKNPIPYTTKLDYFNGEDGGEARFVSVYPDEGRPDIQGDMLILMDKLQQAYVGNPRDIEQGREVELLANIARCVDDYFRVEQPLQALMHIVKSVAQLCHEHGWSFNEAWRRQFIHDTGGAPLDLSDLTTIPPTEH